MKEYKISQFWIVIYALRGLAPLFLGLFIPYLVFIDKSFKYKAGIVIGPIASLALIYYAAKKLIELATGIKQNVRIDENSISVGLNKLHWNEISSITFQPATGFNTAILIQGTNENTEMYVPAVIGTDNLIELGQEIEKRTRKYPVKIKKMDMDGEIVDPDPSNIGKPVTISFESPVKNKLVSSYNMWLSGNLEKLNENMQLSAETASFEGFYKIYTEKDKKLIEDFIKVHEFEDDEFIVATMVNAYLMTNKNLFFPTKNRVISLKNIQSHSSKGWWTVTLTITLVSGEEIVFENLDGVPTDEYIDFFKK